ncbi:TrlF family AAA-like ATPase [Pseudoalteromonas denitrificans]|uniref:AAA domain-containing protein n=1 Tax=Pseudoalteromonas denitrificans DSM 6059 TaxID=1123010 RepID=A0A1I1IKG0_9GAMM|nr:AAA family ATPase [Pseudoalteromonas denitrificans]SFC36726.1 AAA domain-containing protein [Pseudoalteromonas denitrificans DSM 6059]
MIGSVWNKWDLHIHSPFTHQNGQFNGATIDEYVDKIIEEKLSLIGVTNYFYFADGELEAIRQSIANKNAATTALGNVEFRINQQNKDGEWINIHCLFSDKLSTQKINTVLSTFPIFNTTDNDKTIYCSKSSIENSGIQISDAVVDFKLLLKHLNENLRFGIDYLIAVCPNGYGGFRPNMKEGRSTALAKEIEKQGQIILARAEDRNFFLKNLARFDGATEKPVFACSDAHSLNGLGNAKNGSFGIGENYTWVKAKPTFEGLRQTLIEPDSRVQQTDNFVENIFMKPRFKSIELGGEIFPAQAIKFEQQTIPLNPNMVAIIGGRGTGKSLFLDAMHSLFNHNSKSHNARDVNVKSLSITLDQGDGTELTFNAKDDTYSYLHVSQGDIQKFSKEPSELSDEIKRMLGIRYVAFDPVTSSEITENIGKYRSFVQYWESSDPQGNRINTPTHQQGIIDMHTKLMATLTNPQNKQLIAQYQQNLKAANEKRTIITEFREVEAVIQRATSDINQSLNTINMKQEALNKVPLLQVAVTLEKITENIKALEAEISQLDLNNVAIVTSFKEQGIHQDISSLLSKVSESQLAIDNANAKLTEVDQRTSQYHDYVKRRSELVLNYRTYLNQQKDSIDNAFTSLKEQKEHWDVEQNQLVNNMLSDIKINGSITFNVNRFYQGLEDCINRGKFRSTQNKTSMQRLQETFGVITINDFFELIAGIQKITCEGEVSENGEPKLIAIEDLFWKSEYFNQGGRFELLNYLFSPESVKNYLYVNADFEYKGKTVDKLSVGQRGTFYVCLKLATDPFGSPFVFDQPEDDLDNNFIMEQLVPLFSQIKKYRQVIIVTHNANLVVNTDAEQIIVANNEGEVISYETGALEDGSVVDNFGTRASICNILEGGSYAFEKRERKYGIQALV